ncbi:MAG: hypothetical protein AUJ70_04200 [Candidatus Omnitrophica bacterium CG1_02_40_15]|nr:MAG: hypothetical protein AUJ70_04200 [Candidatus Omnitrophica bacterium CG1_02_40_15]
MKKFIIIIFIICSVDLFTTNAIFPLVDDAEKNTTQDNLLNPIIRPPDNANPKPPEYAPGELIVKLKQGQTLQDIKGLNTKYNVNSAEKVFQDTSNPKDSLKQMKDKLASLTAEHQGWYWQLDKDSKEYKDYVAKLEKEKQGLQEQIKAQEELIAKLEERQKRAPEGTTAPNLENIYLLDAGQDANIPLMAKDYANNPAVEYAEPNYKAKAQMVPNDPYYSSNNSWGQGYDDLWGLKKIQCEKAWDISKGKGVIVAVIDTGIDYNHEDIAGNIWINPGEISDNNIDDDKNGYIDDVRGYDFSYNDNNPMDGHGHGTHVAGTIAGIGNNYKGIVGIAPEAKVMAVKGLGDDGSGWDSDLAKCLIYSTNNGADVINNSWEGRGLSRMLEEAVDYAYSKGCVVVAAAGNSNRYAGDYSPAGFFNVISVSSSSHNDLKSDFSNWGKIDVAGPGGDSGATGHIGRNILSLRANGTDMYRDGLCIVADNYYRSRGTSMACPHVVGLAALIISKHPEFSNEAVRQVLRSSADDIGQAGWDKDSGNGRINAYSALSMDSYCSARITSPKENEFKKGGVIQIKGSAYGTSFQSYKLEYKKANDSWVQAGPTSYNPIKDSILGNVTIPPSTFFGTYYLSLTVTDTKGRRFRDVVSILVEADKDLHPGWPFIMESDGQSTLKSSPLIVDIDKDGRKELVINDTSNKIYVLNEDGTYKKGWPVVISDSLENIGISSPAAADLDNDGNLEIIIHGLRYVYIFNKDGIPLRGWPIRVQPEYPSFSGFSQIPAPVIADIDKDKELEIIIAGTDRTLHVLKKDGTYIAGWPKTDLANSGAGMSFTLSVGDIDNDGDMEIVYIDGLCYEGIKRIFVFHHDGRIASGWPKELNESVVCSPVMGDIDGDNDLEIIIGSSALEADYTGTPVVYAYHHNGEIVAGWPKRLDNKEQIAGISLADINMDGYPEVIVSVNIIDFTNPFFPWPRYGVIYVLGKNGEIIWKGNRTDGAPLYSTPIVANINTDSRMEIIIAAGLWQTGEGAIVVFDDKGRQIENLSRYAPYLFWASPAVGDIDGDGKLELTAVTANGMILAWDTNGENKIENTPWPLFQHDVQRAGVYVKASFAPDLAVSNIKFYTPGTEQEVIPQPKKPVTCKAILKNQSNVTAKGFKIKWFLDGKEVKYASHDKLAAGEVSNDPSVYFEWILSVGNHILRFVADTNNEVPESNEKNNFYTRVARVKFVPPVAIIGASPKYGRSPLSVQFKGDKSYDPDGTIVDYLWNFGDKAISKEINPQHVYVNATKRPKVYIAKLTVTDNQGAAKTSFTIIIVYPKIK